VQRHAHRRTFDVDGGSPLGGDAAIENDEAVAVEYRERRAILRLDVE
jgi:hypothetical protein